MKVLQTFGFTWERMRREGNDSMSQLSILKRQECLIYLIIDAKLQNLAYHSLGLLCSTGTGCEEKSSLDQP